MAFPYGSQNKFEVLSTIVSSCDDIPGGYTVKTAHVLTWNQDIMNILQASFPCWPHWRTDVSALGEEYDFHNVYLDYKIM